MNDVSLREYVEAIVKSMDEKHAARAEASEKATLMASAAMDRRLEGMNEFREQLNKQSGTFVTKAELKAELAVLCADIKVLRERQNENRGKERQKSITTEMIFAIIGIVIGVIALVSKFIGG